jgi:hypothetical protein
MSDLVKILLTSGLTIIGGLVVYVFGQIATRFFIDPYHEYRKTVGEIADTLVYYANVYMNPGSGNRERMDEASKILRQKASLLRVRAFAIPRYACLVKFKLVPSPELITKASAALIGLSNNVHSGNFEHNEKRRDEIIEALRLPPLG